MNTYCAVRCVRPINNPQNSLPAKYSPRQIIFARIDFSSKVPLQRYFGLPPPALYRSLFRSGQGTSRYIAAGRYSQNSSPESKSYGLYFRHNFIANRVAMLHNLEGNDLGGSNCPDSKQNVIKVSKKQNKNPTDI